MKNSILQELKTAVAEWAQINNVETTLVDAKYSGIGSNVHVLVVARKGFENWSDYDRHHSLFNFLHAKVNNHGNLVISRLSMMTEEEYEKYDGVEA
jgi:hypothetical protein